MSIYGTTNQAHSKEGEKEMATETILREDQKSEATELMNFLNELTADEKREFLGYMRGVMFIKGMDRKEKQTA